MNSGLARATLRLASTRRATNHPIPAQSASFHRTTLSLVSVTVPKCYLSTTSTLWRRNGIPPAKHGGHQGRNSASRKTTPKGTPKRLEDDRPWQRGETPEQAREAGRDPSEISDSKGRLLTTPTRLLKLILPIPFSADQEHINETKSDDDKRNNDAVAPLALLIHPQQPLSYLERLIQAEIPPVLIKDREKLPDVVFWAETDSKDSSETSSEKKEGSNVASYSGLGREGPKSDEKANWVRWSGSTEMGDFIRDAARGREFAVDIEGHGEDILVAVPSFKDRTHYMRMGLRRMSRQIDQMSKVKRECDLIAHKSAHRLAQGGFAALAGWWGIVYYVTFHTEMGWDMVEPVTYLAGLTTIMAGYLWFLFISRDLSYKAAMNITVSKRQNALYQEKGFDVARWEHLVSEANSLRKDIRMIASEYDVEWDELKDLGGSDVKDALEKEEKGEDKEDGEKEEKNKKEDDKKQGNDPPETDQAKNQEKESSAKRSD